MSKMIKREKKQTDKYRKVWIIFKNGKAEIWFILNLYNTIQLWQIRGQNMHKLTVILFGMVGLSLIVGYLDIKKIKTANPYLNPYTQDNLKSAIAIQNGFIQLGLGNNVEAVDYFKEARRLREKWLDI